MIRVLKWLTLSSAALGLGFAAFVALTWAPDRALESLKPRWATSPSQFIDINGLSTHVRDVGPRDDPTPILLIHGTSASLHTWDGWVAALSKTRRVITMDLPGFGLTGPNATDDYRIVTYTRFILDVADALKVQRFTVGGNSLGGEIAWNVAVAAPTRVDRLILVDAGGYAFVPKSIPLGFRIARIAWLAPLFENTLPRSLIAASLKNVYGDPTKVSDELIDRYYEITQRAGNRKAVRARFTQLTVGSDPTRIKQIQAKTLVIWGVQDRLIPPENGALFVRDVVGAKLVQFDDLGHVPHEEDAARTVAAVIDFLK